MDGDSTLAHPARKSAAEHETIQREGLRTSNGVSFPAADAGSVRKGLGGRRSG
jgi:hypothetical protein